MPTSILGSIETVSVCSPPLTSQRPIAEVATPGQWIVGGGWNEMLWGGGTPAAAWLDAVTPDAPVYLTRMDGHSALANSAALRAAGIDDYTPDPAGGRIIRDAAGAATGMLACAPSKPSLCKYLSRSPLRVRRRQAQELVLKLPTFARALLQPAERSSKSSQDFHACCKACAFRLL